MKVKSCKNDIIWTEIESLELLLGVNFGILLNRIVRLELQVNYWGGDLRKLGRRYRRACDRQREVSKDYCSGPLGLSFCPLKRQAASTSKSY